MKRSFIITSGVLYAGIALALCTLPLFNALGYESSVALAIAAAFIGGCTTIRSAPRREAGVPDADAFFLWLRQTLVVHLLLLALPLAILALNAFRIPNCSLAEGAAFYLLIPCVTAVFAVTAAAWSSLFFKRPGVAYALILLACAIYPLATGYFTPAIYSYNVIYGFFPGFSYDESIRITPQLFMMRGLTLLVCVVLIVWSGEIVAQPRVGFTFRDRWTALVKGPKRIHLAGLIALLVCFFFLRTHLGLESSTDAIRRVLDDRLQTDHFTIYFQTGSFTDEEAGWVAAEHEFRLMQIVRDLDLKFDGRIDSYIYPDEKTKRECMGAGATNIAKPWRGEIHLNKASWSDVLKHELVHACAAEFGMPVIRAHYNIGLVEGLATAIDNDFGNRTLQEYGAGLKQFGLLKDPAMLTSSVGFATQSSSISYVAMGAFCRYLIDTYGIARLKAWYGGSTPADLYGKGLDELVKEWWNRLDDIHIPATEQSHFLYMFHRPSIFAKECARAIATMNEDGWRSLAGNMSVDAAARFRRSLAKVWTSEAFSGFIRASYQAAQYDTVCSAMLTALADPQRRPVVQGLTILFGDALWWAGEYALADSVYARAESLDISDRFTDAAVLRRAVLSDSMLRPLLPPLFSGEWSDSVALVHLGRIPAAQDNPVIHLLAGRLFLRLGNTERAIQALLDTTCERALPSLKGLRLRLLAQAYLHDGRYTLAIASLQYAKAGAVPESGRLRIGDDIDRCVWLHSGGSRFLLARPPH